MGGFLAWRNEPEIRIDEGIDNDNGKTWQELGFSRGDQIRWFCHDGFKKLTGIDVEPGDVFECEMIQTKKGFEFNVLKEWTYLYDE